MRNLRQLLRRSGWLSSESKRARNEQKSHSEKSRRLQGEMLEKRQLLASDIAFAHNYLIAGDANQDRAITAADALAVINFMNRNGSGVRITDATMASSMVDVNADHVVTAADALAVINRLNLGEGVGELVELFIEPRNASDGTITPTSTTGGVRNYTVNVGEIFFLELSYADLRTPDSQALGAFQISTDISLSQSGVLQPVLTELQTLTFDPAFNVAGQSGSFTFGLSGPLPGQTTTPDPVTIDRNNFFNRGVFEVSQALVRLGYNASQFRVTNLTRTVAAGQPPAEPIIQIAYRDLNLGGLDLPNPVIGGTTDPVQIRTAAPFNPDGSINGAALPSSYDTRSRNFVNDAGDTNREFYNQRSFGTFNPAATTDAFNEVGVLGQVVAGGITGESQFDFLVEPVDAFSIPVRFTQPVTNLQVSLNPAEDAEAILLYPGGAGTTLIQDDVLINPATGSFTISAIGVGTTPTVSVVVSPASVVEDGAANLVYTFSRTGSTTGPLTINYATSGTATAGTDFIGTGTSVVIPDGQASVTVTVDPTVDTTAESNETVVLTISPNAAYTVSPTAGAATGTITDDDGAATPTVSVAVSPTSVLEDGTANLVYTFTRTGATTSALTVNYATSGTAASGTDFTGTGTNVVIPVGASSVTVTVDPSVDAIDESDETVILTVTPDAAYTVSPTAGAATGTITDDDGVATPTVSVTVAPSAVNEDGAGVLVYTFTRSGATTEALTVNYSVAGTAMSGIDFPALDGTVTIPVGQASATVSINPTDDTTEEPDETIVLTVTDAAAYDVGTPSSASGTITNDDVVAVLPTVTVSVSPSSVTEDGTANLVYTFARTGATSSALTINYAVSGTATAGTDFTGTGTSVVIPVGASSVTVTADPSSDTTVEPDETVILTISPNAAVYTVGTAGAATGTITNDDLGPSTISVAVSPASVVENGTPNLVYTFTRTGGNLATALTVNYSVSGTATSGTDFTGTSTSVAFAANATTATVTVDPTQDSLTEGNETVVLTITPNNGAYNVSATAGAATGTITDPPVTNQPPVVSGPVTRTLTENDPAATVNLLANASDPNATDVLSVSNLTVTSGNAAGIVQSGNSLNVTPSAYKSLTGGQNAVVVYSYNVTDGNGGSTPTNATVTITGVNDAPVAVNDNNLTAFAGGTARLDVLANDNAGGGETQALTVTAATVISGNATVAPTADGTAVNLTAPAGVTGTVTFSYTVRDAGGATAIGTATVNVQNFNPSTISGAVFFDNIMNISAVISGATPVRDGIKSADETAIGGVAIRLESGANENATNQAISRTVFTQLDGSYQFTNLPPGTYRVSYVIPETIVYGRDIAGSAGSDGTPNGSMVVTIAQPGGSTNSGFNFTAYGTRGTGAAGSGIGYLDLLTTSYLGANSNIFAMSNGGREGGTVSLSATGTQEFVNIGEGFGAVRFAEFTLNATGDAALLTIIGADNVARTARLSSDHFVASADGRSVRFFGGQEDFTFVNSDTALIQQEFANFRNLVDQIMASIR